MQTTRSIYRGFCFPPEVIAHAVFLYHRFPLSLRDVEDLLAQRGIAVSYETIRRWCRRFGPHYARNVRRQQPTAGDHWLLDEVFLQIQGRRQYLWRAIDQDGDILDILMQRRRNGRAATRFVRKLLKQQQRSPNRLVTDKLGSYRVAHRAEIASVPHDTTQYANNRIEASHRRTRVRERQMLRFRSAGDSKRPPRYDAVREQSNRSISPPHPSPRATDAAISVGRKPAGLPRATVSQCSSVHIELVQLGPPSVTRQAISLLSSPSVRRVVVGNSWISSRTRLATCRCLF